MDRIERGRFRHVPQEVRHAWKNQSDEPAIAIIVTTSRLGRFFQEVGRPVAAAAFPQPPVPGGCSTFRRGGASLSPLARQRGGKGCRLHETFGGHELVE